MTSRPDKERQPAVLAATYAALGREIAFEKQTSHKG